MDPQAALDSAESALQSNDPLRCIELLFGYYNWRVRGGHQPPRGDDRAAELSPRALDAFAEDDASTDSVPDEDADGYRTGDIE